MPFHRAILLQLFIMFCFSVTAGAQTLLGIGGGTGTIIFSGEKNGNASAVQPNETRFPRIALSLKNFIDSSFSIGLQLDMEDHYLSYDHTYYSSYYSLHEHIDYTLNFTQLGLVADHYSGKQACRLFVGGGLFYTLGRVTYSGEKNESWGAYQSVNNNQVFVGDSISTPLEGSYGISPFGFLFHFGANIALAKRFFISPELSYRLGVLNFREVHVMQGTYVGLSIKYSLGKLQLFDRLSKWAEN